jgi:hypothetical protein
VDAEVLMKPKHVVRIESEKFNRWDVHIWCAENVGKPFRVVGWDFDFNNDEAKWCCYCSEHGSDHWYFRDERDAVMFSLRWA